MQPGSKLWKREQHHPEHNHRGLSLNCVYLTVNEPEEQLVQMCSADATTILQRTKEQIDSKRHAF